MFEFLIVLGIMGIVGMMSYDLGRYRGYMKGIDDFAERIKRGIDDE